jgi:hypothetical protein
MLTGKFGFPVVPYNAAKLLHDFLLLLARLGKEDEGLVRKCGRIENGAIDSHDIP